MTGCSEWGLEEHTLSGHELHRVQELNGRYPNPSPRDLAVLLVADIDDGIVVTGNGPLRSAAEAEGQTVHAVLWILDQVVEQAVIRPPRRLMPWSSKAVAYPKRRCRGACIAGGVVECCTIGSIARAGG